jgi:hypothetical protein
MNQIAVINGIMYSWANISLLLFGGITRGVKGIKYGYKQDKKNVYGYGIEPIGRTYGNIEYHAEIILLRDEVQSILTGLKSKGMNKLTDIGPFDIPVIYGANPAAGLNPVPAAQSQDTLLFCEFLDFNFDGKQNDQEFDMTLPLIVGGIQHV